jgi:pilus assembly protein CpaC
MIARNHTVTRIITATRGLDRRHQGTEQGMNTMDSRRGFRRALAALSLTIGLMAAAPATAETAASVAPENLSVPVGSHKLMRLQASVARIAIGDPKVADVNVVNGRELLLLGKAEGTTSLLIWPSASKKKKAPPVEPKEYLVIVGGLAGTTSDLLDHRRAELAAASGDKNTVVFDRSLVAVESQVTSDVKVVEVNRTTLQQYGFNLLHPRGATVQNFTTPGSLSAVQPTGGTATFTSPTGFLPISDAFNIIFGNNDYLGILSVLERKGLARVLAEPSLTAVSGQTATFLAGGEFPVPVPQSSGGTGIATVTIQYKEYGVRLNLTPTVLSSKRIALKVAPEVSELDYTNGVNLNGFVIPGLIVRRTDTTVELGDGESFVLSGLVSNTMKANVDKVPLLGDLPIIGAFFKSNTYQRDEKELIMVVTPHLVRPFTRNAQLPSLPGARIDGYQPNVAETMFLERGNFGQGDHGYSR